MTAVHWAPKALPVVLKPVDDELLSSWIARHAEYYSVSPLAMLRHCLPDATSLRAADLRLNSEQAARIALIFRSAPAEIRRMSHADIPQDAVRLLAPKAAQKCSGARKKTPSERSLRRDCVARSKVGDSLAAVADPGWLNSASVANSALKNRATCSLIFGAKPSAAKICLKMRSSITTGYGRRLSTFCAYSSSDATARAST